MTTTYAMLPKIHGCAGCGRDVLATATAHQSSVANEIAKEAMRMYRRNCWEPGRYRSAGIAVWLMTKNSGKPHFSRAPPAGIVAAPFESTVRAFMLIGPAADRALRFSPWFQRCAPGAQPFALARIGSWPRRGRGSLWMR